MKFRMMFAVGMSASSGYIEKCRRLGVCAITIRPLSVILGNASYPFSVPKTMRASQSEAAANRDGVAESKRHSNKPISVKYFPRVLVIWL